MKSITILSIIVISSLLNSCSKGGDTGSTPTTPTTPVETKISTLSINIDKGNEYFGATAATQSLDITASPVPTAGISATIVTNRELDGVEISRASKTSLTSPITLVIDNLTAGVACITTVKVKSQSDSTNSITKTFKIARK